MQWSKEVYGYNYGCYQYQKWLNIFFFWLCRNIQYFYVENLILRSHCIVSVIKWHCTFTIA